MRALYAFSGDPITYGHIDIVERAARTYREVVVGIGENPQKTGKYLFTTAERLALARECLAHLPNVTVTIFGGLLGEYAFRHGFDVIVRGVRNNSDFEGELVLYSVVESLHHQVDMAFFPARRSLSHISSGVVKAIVSEGGDVSKYCPLRVKEELEKRLLGRFSVAVAGGVAAGKTYVARELVARLSQRLTASYVSLDNVGHYILGPSPEPIYQATRQRIAERFGAQVMLTDGTIDRRILGRIVFGSHLALDDLNELMREPMLARLYEETCRLPHGVIVLEGAIFVEAGWTNLVNNNVILVDAPEAIRQQRLMARSGIDADEARTKIERQITPARRKELMQRRIREQRWGRLWEIDDSGNGLSLEALTDELVQLAGGPRK
jgi:pantetheine-phosphate adenylyltransferase